jgi:hypothetical protein
MGQPNGSCKSWQLPKLPGCCHGGPGIVEKGGAEEEKKESEE